MYRRQPLPRLWLMTDERQGERLWDALRRLPRGSGIVLRHYGLGLEEKRELARQVRLIARRRRLILLVAGSPGLARAWRADGSHGRRHPQSSERLRSAPAHNLREIRKAERSGVDLIFLSPVFPTRSHPDGLALGRVRFELLARQSRLPVIALGGMDAKRARSLSGLYGWAGIDAWSA